MTSPIIIIKKADGREEPFDSKRLVASLERSGANTYVANRIAQTITDSVLPGTSSKEIYAHAFALMRREARPIAARYSLRRALLELGPTGHPFEDFVSHLFRAEGWEVETRKILPGRCATHEIDFFASRSSEGVHIAAELKYHNDPAYKTDLKVALYVKSRFDDIAQCDEEKCMYRIDRGILITNTKFSSEAITYAECAGVELLGWGYPHDNSLFMRMDRAKVYPLTTLTVLSRAEKRFLIDHGIIAVDELVKNRDVLDFIRLSPEKAGKVLAEANGLLLL